MKLSLIIFTFILLTKSILAQNKEEILAEAYLLYHSEKASWHATDILLEKFPETQKHLGGYLSYTENNLHHCIFFDRKPSPDLLLKISFNDDFNVNSAKIDTITRKLTKIEQDLFEIRKKALTELGTDTLFKYYEDMRFNPIPIITKKEKKVFVLTGPNKPGFVVIGNDYLLTFNKKNKLKSKKALHNNILILEYEDNNEQSNEVISYHNHLKSSGDLISSTDLCTLMLYGKIANWQKHIVISEKNVSLWDCNQEKLLIMTKKAWENLNNVETDK